MSTDVRLVQPENIPFRLVTVPAIEALTSPEHPSNTPPSISHTEFGISTETRLLQFSNAHAEIFFNELGNDISDKFVQSAKAYNPIEINVFGNEMFFNFLHAWNALSPMLVMPPKDTDSNNGH